MTDLDKNQNFNLVSEISKELVRSMGNTEYFEMCETTSKVVLSIQNSVIQKNPSHGARHGPTERQRIHQKVHNTLRKANKRGHTTMLARFLNDPFCRDSQIKFGWDENTCIANDEIAKEDHSYVATRCERSSEESLRRFRHCH